MTSSNASIRPLSDLCDIVIGRTPPRARKEYWSGPHRWLSISDMGRSSRIVETKETISAAGAQLFSERLVAPGTVLLSFKLSIGKVAIADVPLYTNEAIAALPIKNKSQLIPAYLLRYLEFADLVAGADRAAMGNTLNLAKLRSIGIPVVPIAEQHRIASILDRADALRAQRRRALALIDEYEKATFAAITDDPFVSASSLPLKNLLLRIDSGKSPICQDRPARNEEWGVLKLGAISSGEFVPQNNNKAILPDSEPDGRHEVQPGDILFSRKNTLDLVGASVFVDGTPPRMLLPDLIFRLVPDPSAPIRPRFLQRALAQPITRERLRQLAGGSAASMSNISKARLLEFSLRVPPLEAQIEFENAARRVANIRAKQRGHLAKLDELFVSLQQQLFEGRL